jgi:hypothetical protein
MPNWAPQVVTGQASCVASIRVTAFLDKMHAAAAEAAEPVDPWRFPLERACGAVGFDGLERISTQAVLDLLEVPARKRTAGTYRRLAKQMAALGWTAVRVRDLTRGGYKEQVRGYVRDAREAEKRKMLLAGHRRAVRAACPERASASQQLDEPQGETVKPQQGTTFPPSDLAITGEENVD